ncbi:MAG: ADP-ribosylglycohydrolase family protein, partial [Planctomycetota bacterium]|nr:ADP-ribosylglycohydrolase family protein [Planctomycetota bacterium]
FRSDSETREWLAWSALNTEDKLDHPIITPYVIPTVLGSLWAILSHPQSWIDAVGAAVALGGDVDTLGAIVGAVMGAKLGFQSIPKSLRSTVQRRDEIEELARGLSALFREH